jgi:lambda family phage portal protein
VKWWKPRIKAVAKGKPSSRAMRAAKAVVQTFESEFGGGPWTRYAGAATDRTNRGHFRDGAESADAALLPELQALRSRSRELFRNNPTARGVVEAFVSNVIGKGLTIQSRIDWKTLSISKDRAQKIQRMMEAGWRNHCKTMDYADRLNYRRMQPLAYREKLICGESLMIRRYVDPKARGRKAKYGTCWQLVDPDRLQTPYDRMNDANVRYGVELGDRGQPVAYWIAREHPSDVATLLSSKTEAFTRVPAFDRDGRPLVIHDYEQLRSDQTRGVPILATIIRTLHGIEEYVDIEMIAAMCGAMYAAFIEVEDKYDDNLANTFEEQPVTNSEGTSSVQALQRMEPGIIERLNKGEKVTLASPNRPNNGLEAFLTFRMRSAGTAVGLPYELLSHDWSKTTYTSGRMALLDAWRLFDTHIAAMVESFCEPLWEAAIEEQVLRGELPNLRGWDTNRDAWTRMQAIAPGRQWVDPLKDVKAREVALAQNLTTLEREWAEMGDDWEDALDQRHEEALREMELQAVRQERAKELGLIDEPDPSVPEPDPEQDILDEGDNSDGNG